MAICVLKTFGLNWTTSDFLIFNESWECFQHSTFTPFQTESMVVAPILVSKKRSSFCWKKMGSSYISYSCFPKNCNIPFGPKKEHDFRDIPTAPPSRALLSNQPHFQTMTDGFALTPFISTPIFCLSPPTTSELQRKAPVIRRRFCCFFLYLRWFSNV